jgi:hypothetical protein
MESADALVLGRATYGVFAASWPARAGVLADRINSLPKYVASRTLTDVTWNAQILQDDAVEAVANLRCGYAAEVRHRLVQPSPSRRRAAGRVAPVGVPVHRRIRGGSPTRNHDHTPGPGRGDRDRQRRRRVDLHAEAVALGWTVTSTWSWPGLVHDARLPRSEVSAAAQNAGHAAT